MSGCNAYNSYEVHVQGCMPTGIYQIYVQIYLFIRVCVTQDQCKYLHVCPVHVHRKLKNCWCNTGGTGGPLSSAFHQKTPQILAKLPSRAAQPSGKSKILDRGPT